MQIAEGSAQDFIVYLNISLLVIIVVYCLSKHRHITYFNEVRYYTNAN